MNIIICIKQVPDNIGTRIDGYYNAVNRSETEGIINPSDLFAIGKAIQIKEKNGWKINCVMHVIAIGQTIAKTMCWQWVEEQFCRRTAFCWSLRHYNGIYSHGGIKRLVSMILLYV